HSRPWLPVHIRHPYPDPAERMEKKWAYDAALAMKGVGDDLRVSTLTDWQKRVRDGTQPAIIFNSTMVETGERLCFSTAPLRHYSAGQMEFVSSGPGEPQAPYRQLYPGAELLITTAARLPATFPVL